MPRGVFILDIERNWNCRMKIEEWDDENEYSLGITLGRCGQGWWSTGTIDEVKADLRKQLVEYSTNCDTQSDRDSAKWLIEKLDKTNQISLF